MIYFAHRGASAHAPANSLPAFALARQQGATHYELDVHLSKDGHLIVHHDYNLGTDTSCGLDIKEATLADLKACYLVHHFDADLVVRPPLLHEVMHVISDELKLVNIEIKNDDNVYPGIERAVWDYVQNLGPQALKTILFSSFDFATLQRLRALSARVKIGLLTRAFEIEQVRAIKAYSVHMNQTRITPQIVQACHAENCKVFVYTVNTQAQADKLAQMGVDGIFTDDPGLFLQHK